MSSSSAVSYDAPWSSCLMVCRETSIWGDSLVRTDYVGAKGGKGEGKGEGKGRRRTYDCLGDSAGGGDGELGGATVGGEHAAAAVLAHVPEVRAGVQGAEERVGVDCEVGGEQPRVDGERRTYVLSGSRRSRGR